MKNVYSKVAILSSAFTKLAIGCKRLTVKDEGQGLVEYGLIIGLVAIVLIAALGLLTGGLQNVFTVITATLSKV